MYRGARVGDPSVLTGPSYFISDEPFARTYGRTARFSLKISKPLIVSNDEWLEYSTIGQYQPIEDVAAKLRAMGHDSVVNVRKTPAGNELWLVFLLDPSQAALANPNVSRFFSSPMPEFLRSIGDCVVVVGSVARTIRDPDFTLPKDIDLLVDLDSDRCRKKIGQQIARLGLEFESPFIASWTFRNYGWMVEIIGIHHGPPYRTVRRRAERMDIDGIVLWVAQAKDVPKFKPTQEHIEKLLANKDEPKKDWQSIFTKHNLPPAPGDVVDMRWKARTDDWYVKTEAGWYWLRGKVWTQVPYGPD